MDKYEQAVKKYLQNPMYEWTPQELFEEELARFANLLGERREKETCEWMVVEKDGDGNPLSFKSTCGEWWHVHEDSVKHHDVCCPRCGGRIVEVKDE